MGRAKEGKTMALSAMVLVAGLFFHSHAYAVAGKTVPINVGTSLAGATLEFEMNEGPPVTVQVDPQGQAEIPEDVNQRTVRACYRKEQSAAGETKRRIDCAGWLPAGGAAASAGWTAAQETRSGWRFDATILVGGTTTLGKPDATSTGTGFGTGTSSLGSLTGPTGSLMLRAYLPAPGFLGNAWIFGRYNEQFNRKGTGGDADVHLPVPGNDTSTTLTRGRDLEAGVGYTMPTVKGQAFGVYAGASFQQNKISTRSNEAGPIRMFEREQWKTSVVAGAWYLVPLGEVAPGWEHLGAVLGVDFRRVPCMSVNGQSPITTYQGRTESFWEATPYVGINYSF